MRGWGGGVAFDVGRVAIARKGGGEGGLVSRSYEEVMGGKQARPISHLALSSPFCWGRARNLFVKFLVRRLP